MTDSVALIHWHAPAKDAAIAQLREWQPELEALGAREIWLFGSVARGDDTAESDLDVALVANRPHDFMAKAVVWRFLDAKLDRCVDAVVFPISEKLAAYAEEDMVRVF